MPVWSHRLLELFDLTAGMRILLGASGCRVPKVLALHRPAWVEVNRLLIAYTVVGYNCRQ